MVDPGLRLPLKVGQKLKVPPVPGVVVFVKKGDSPASLATSYGVDETTILGFNHIRAPELITVDYLPGTLNNGRGARARARTGAAARSGA